MGANFTLDAGSVFLSASLFLALHPGIWHSNFNLDLFLELIHNI